MYRNIKMYMGKMMHIEVRDDKTMALYQEVKQQSASSLFLYDALIDYQNKHQLNSKQTNIETVE